MDDDLRGMDASEGVRIIGAAEAAPGARAVVPTRRSVPAVGSWDDDEAGWDDEWISGDGDLDDPDHEGRIDRTPMVSATDDGSPDVSFDDDRASRAPTRRVTIDDDHLAGDDGREAWKATQGPRWRAEGDDWNDAYDDGDLADWADGAAVGPLDPNRAESSDLYSFDGVDEVGLGRQSGSGPDEETVIDPEIQTFADDFDDEAQPLVGATNSRSPRDSEPRRPQPRVATDGERTVGRAGTRRPNTAQADRRPIGPAARPVSSSLGMRVITGVALVAAFGIILYLLKARGAVALVCAVLALAVFEFFTALRQRGFQPAILPGALATLLLPVVAYNKGSEGIVLTLLLAALTTTGSSNVARAPGRIAG